MEANIVTSENLQAFNLARLGVQQPVEDAKVISETPASEVSPEEKAEETKEEPKHEKKGNPKIEARFSELAEKRRAAEERAEAAARRAEEAERKAQELEARLSPKPAQADLPAEPKQADFTDPFEFARALAKYETAKALHERDERQRKEAQDREGAKVRDAWSKRLAATKAEIPDFDEILASSQVKVSDDVRDAIIESDVGPKLLIHLAQNPELADKIAGMSVRAALREIGKLEAQLEKKPEPKPAADEERKPEPKPKAEVMDPIKAKTVPDLPVNSKGEFTGGYDEYKRLRKAGRI